MTRPPSRRATSTQAKPTPPAAPVIRTVSPGCSRARSDEGVPRRDVGVENGRSGDEIDVVGDARALRGFGDHALRKAAEPICAGDTVAAAKAFDLVADGDDDSGCVGSRDIREGWPQLISAANHQIVHVADGGRMNVDHNLVVSRPRFGRLAKSQRVDSFEALAKHRAHGRLMTGRALSLANPQREVSPQPGIDWPASGFRVRPATCPERSCCQGRPHFAGASCRRVHSARS